MSTSSEESTTPSSEEATTPAPAKDWTTATLWAGHERDRWPLLCLWPSRSDWPVYHYDGRWRCSEMLGHDGEHEARTEHKTDGEVCWTGPWVPAEAFESSPDGEDKEK